jgi:hypothetical protein
MRPSARFVVPVVVLAALAACTGDGGDGATSMPPTSTSPTPVVSVSVPPGEGVYVYQNGGLTATLELGAGTGTLRIANGTGRELAPPSFYLLDARDGRRVPGTVENAEATPNGASTDFGVTFSGLEVKNIGLAVLLIGSDNYGAFVKQ